MSVPSLDLSKLSYSKPTPPDFAAFAYSPYSCAEATQIYQQELAVWNTHQAQIQATAQELSASQQKMNDSHSKLLRQYEDIQQQLLLEVAAHHEETQEVKKLKSDMDTMTRFLHDLLIKK
jgi:hypothetical protein